MDTQKIKAKITELESLLAKKKPKRSEVQKLLADLLALLQEAAKDFPMVQGIVTALASTIASYFPKSKKKSKG
jgi:hypothetical protein